MRRLAMGILFVLLFTLFAPAALAQETGERRVIPVSVIDREGKLVEGLTAADFRGEFRGQPVTIHSVAWDESSRAILLLIDVSGSMRSNPSVLQFAWSVAKQFAAALHPIHDVGIVMFSEKAVYHELIDDMPSDEQLDSLRDYVQENWRKLGGSTSMNDAVGTAARMESGGRPVQVLLVISDGMDTVSALGQSKLRLILGEQRTRLFYFLLPAQFAEGEIRSTKRTRQNATDLVESTGGRQIDFSRGVPNEQDGLAEIPALVESMTKNYVLEVELARPVDKPQGWSLEVVDATGRKRKVVEVAYPRLLVPLESEKKKKKKE